MLPLRSRIYFASVAAGAGFILALLPWGMLYEMEAPSLVGLGVLIIIGIIGEALSYSFAVGESKAHSSVSFVPILAAAVLFNAAAAVGCALAIILITELAIVRKVPWKAIFNAAQVTVATVAASTIYAAFADSSDAIALTGFFAASTVFFLVNQACVGGFIALAQNTPFIPTVRKIAGGSGSNLLFDVLVSPIALVVAILFTLHGPAGLLVIALPLLLLRHAYLSKHQAQEANKDLLKVLIKTIETRDPYTSGHSVRVSVLARVIAEDLRVSRTKIDAIETAALLHDIGKIDGVYSRIISKPHSLNEDERAIIRTHAVKGAEFLRSLSSFNEAIVQGVKHHHERYDGQGYPDGLKGAEIPLAARVIMLCDAIDAMLSDRPYRKALSIPVVLKEIEEHSGRQFDPAIVATISRNDTLLRAVDLIDQWERPHASTEETRYRITPAALSSA